MTRLEALVALNLISDIGSARLERLLKFFEKPEDILRAGSDRLIRISGINKKTAQQLSSLKKEDLDKEFTLARRLGLDILTLDDDGYPEGLKEIPSSPIILYVKGDLLPADKMSVAIVGSRRASFYGLNSAREFAFGLSEVGFTIVSGMARGVDTQAHRGALKAGGRTIAVIGSGFLDVYPPENLELAEEISRNGAVISEFPIGARPWPQNFPRRNRIISGLSLGVLVTEAARHSGALITADFALEQGRDVFALPGRVGSKNCWGTNDLIKQGAKLVTGIEDILEEYPFLIRKAIEVSKSREAPKVYSLDIDQSRIYNMILEEAIQLDELIEKSNTGVQSISKILLGLQLKKLIKPLAGKNYIRSN